MIYTYENSPGAKVFSHDGVEITHVMSVDTDANTITVCDQPIRVVNDDIVVFNRVFKKIEIELYCGFPSVFRCIGEISK